MSSVVDRARLRVTDDWIVIDALTSSSVTSHNSLFLCRNTGRIFEKQERPALEQSPHIDCVIFGIVGIIESIGNNNYLVYIKEREWIGKFLQHDIYKVSLLDWVPVKQTVAAATQSNQSYLLSTLQATLLQTQFYYSASFMLTRRLQSIYTSNIDEQVKPLCWSADKRFFWNQYLAKSFIENKLYSWVIPLMSGFVRCEVFSFHSKVVRYILISRISCERAGPRYHCRGSDPDGNVANFVETEQIITYYDNVFSFVQIRGSIPVIWKQTPNLKYKPKIQIYSSKAAEEFSHDSKDKAISPFTTLIRHFERLKDNYGPQVAVSLIDQKGSEARLGDLYQSGTRENFPSTVVEYIAWDFHRFCKGMRFDRVYQLVQQLESSLDSFGYYYRKLGDDSLAPWLQKGIIRTNCIDCLDRTNVLQSAIAEVILTKQLRQLQIISQEQSIKDFPLEYSKFSNIWADHADAISEYYAGTGALKTDYTRTGKRSYRGIAVDGWRSLLRYWKNNFVDGYKQDAYNVLLGKVQSNTYKTPIPSYWKQLSWKEKWIPFLCLVAVVSCVWSVFSLRNVSWKYRIAYFLSSFSILVRGLSFIISHGEHYAVQPRLTAKIS